MGIHIIQKHTFSLFICVLIAKYSAQNKFKSYRHHEYLTMLDDETGLISQILNRQGLDYKNQSRKKPLNLISGFQ